MIQFGLYVYELTHSRKGEQDEGCFVFWTHHNDGVTHGYSLVMLRSYL